MLDSRNTFYGKISALVTETLGHNENSICGLLAHPSASGVDRQELADYIAGRYSAAPMRMTGQETIWAKDVEVWMPLLVEACDKLVNDAVAIAMG